MDMITPPACEAFLHEEYPRLVGFLRLHFGVDAEDIAQDAAVTLVDHWGRLDTTQPPRAWLYTVALRKGYRVGRRLRRFTAALPLIATPSTGPDLAESSAITLDTRRALAALPERQRAALVLRYYCDLPVAAAAKVLGTSDEALRALCHRAVVTLRATDLHPADL